MPVNLAREAIPLTADELEEVLTLWLSYQTFKGYKRKVHQRKVPRCGNVRRDRSSPWNFICSWIDRLFYRQ